MLIALEEKPTGTSLLGSLPKQSTIPRHTANDAIAKFDISTPLGSSDSSQSDDSDDSEKSNELTLKIEEELRELQERKDRDSDDTDDCDFTAAAAPINEMVKTVFASPFIHKWEKAGTKDDKGQDTSAHDGLRQSPLSTKSTTVQPRSPTSMLDGIPRGRTNSAKRNRFQGRETDTEGNVWNVVQVRKSKEVTYYRPLQKSPRVSKPSSPLEHNKFGGLEPDDDDDDDSSDGGDADSDSDI